MKVTLEFESLEDYFEQLPRFAATVNFAGQFVTLTRRAKDGSEAKLDEPDLPQVEIHPDRFTVHSTQSMTAQEVGEALSAVLPAKSEPDMQGASDAAESANNDKPKPKAEEKPKPKAEPTVTKEDVRAVLAALNRRKREKVAELLGEFNARSLSGVNPEDYAELLEKAKDALEKVNKEEQGNG